MTGAVVRIRELSVCYRTRDSTVHAVDDVSLDLERGSVLALVGESGSGKSTVGLSVLRLLPQHAEITAGSIWFGDEDMAEARDETLRRIRGRQMSMVFQDPIAGLNPVLTIGDQVAETLINHLALGKKEAKRQAVEILTNVGLADPERLAKAYPFQLSGGMCQRVMIGIATALNPDVLIADEPTSSLDVTVQAQILHQLGLLAREKGTAILLITHNFGVVAHLADKVAVMYGGRIVERGSVDEILKRPLHPYSFALLSTLPRLDGSGGPLRSIPGSPPEMTEAADRCPFIPRCNKALTVCRESPAPALERANEVGQEVACYNPVWQG
ncbi:MAG: ABC transporter ATP-binding protein [Dehalococcoidia bacterium]